MNRQLKEIEKAIIKNSTRGMQKLSTIMATSFCMDAAESLIKIENRTVFMTTGFYKEGVAETDGPIGTYFLAEALVKLGFKVIFLTDLYCEKYFDYRNDKETIYLPLEKDDCKKKCQEILKKYKPGAIISIERCGRNEYQKYFTMNNENISDYTANIDELFLLADKETLTIGIGDGGNEIGMGKYSCFIKENFQIEPSIIDVDHLIIAAVSNWGAYGLIACLEILSKEILIPDFEEMKNYMAYILDLGAIDGVFLEKKTSTDGFDIHYDQSLLKKLKELARV